MGARSSTETALRVLAALLDEPTWKQAELARHVGVSTQTVKRCLEELERFRKELAVLSEEEDEPAQVVQLNMQLFPLSTCLGEEETGS